MSLVPGALLEEISRRTGGPVRPVRAVSGGDINRAAVVDCGNVRCFLKWNGAAPSGVFRLEAEGLDALAAPGALAVPWPLHWADAGAEHPGFLLMRYLESGEPGPGDGEALGRGLAATHRAAGIRYGWEHHNYIGSLPQMNPQLDDWAVFWRDARVRPLLKRASRRLEPETIDDLRALIQRLPELLPASPPASLLHGDLWSGNYLICDDGRPAIFDPAVYRGDREVDLAMAALFGGFPDGFEAAYREAWPLEPGWEERRPIYQLYPLLVHTILFGGSYAEQVAQIASRFRLSGVGSPL